MDRTASREWSKALAVARGIPLPWYRAQSFAHLSDEASDTDWPLAVAEGWQAVWAADESYKRVAVASWMVRAEIWRTRTLSAGLLDRLLDESTRIENTGSKADALQLLWSAVFNCGPEFRAQVEQAAVTAATEARSWRGPPILQTMVFALLRDSRDQAAAVFQRIPDGRIKRQTLRRLARRDWHWDGEHFVPGPNALT